MPIGQWSKPILQSRWGPYGKDSSDIEYIYCILDVELYSDVKWPYNDGSNPEEWTNDTNF